ncbi:MAG: type II secretion system secretin GspD [Gammaproteobacteria bacterium]
MSSFKVNFPAFLLSVLVVLLASCATPNQVNNQSKNIPVEVIKNPPADVIDVAQTSTKVDKSKDQTQAKAEIHRGTGNFINKRPAKNSTDSYGAGDDVSLIFQDAPIGEVATTILGDLMGMAYVLDERVTGNVSLKTGRPIPRSALVSVMEGILKANNAVLVDNSGIFHILPAAENLSSVVAPKFSLQEDKGYQIIVVPLRYIAANEMKNILGSIQGAATNIQTDPKRNLMMVSGTQSELKNMLDTIEIFDVDQLEGMSTAIFRLSQANTNTVTNELNTIFNYDAGSADESNSTNAASIIRFVPIERINAVLVITPQARYLDTVQQWVNRLDVVDSSIDRALHVYFVQNVRSGYLAGILQELFDADVSTQESQDSRGNLSPGSSGDTQSSFGTSGSLSTSADSLDGGTPSGPSSGGLGSLQRSAFSSNFNNSNNSGGDNDSPIKIIADEENNALVIKATKDEYADIEDAIKRLDIVPLQVLVEATIVEVSLTGNLSYGLEWFFRNNNVLDGNDGIATLDTGAAGSGLLALSPGFSYQIVDSAGGIRAVLNTLATDSKIKVVSSPSLMVLDNHSASINIGDQVPVRTSESTNTGTAGNDSIVTSTIQFVETGVTLEVAPRVSKGGNVVMDIFQSIRTADITDTSSIDSPTINQRQVQTSVAVQSGETIVLGGLIQDDDGRSNSGIPGLRNLPVAGFLFGSTAKTSQRTELLVLITPTAVRDSTESKAATEELRDKLKGLKLPELDSDGTIKATEYKGIRW